MLPPTWLFVAALEAFTTVCMRPKTTESYTEKAKRWVTLIDGKDLRHNARKYYPFFIPEVWMQIHGIYLPW